MWLVWKEQEGRVVEMRSKISGGEGGSGGALMMRDLVSHRKDFGFYFA